MQARWFFVRSPGVVPARPRGPAESFWARLGRRYIDWAEACHGALRGSRALG